MSIAYLDFDLEISLSENKTYLIRVVSSPAGEGRATMIWPYDQQQLESRLKDLHIALLKSVGLYRFILSPQQKAVQTFGSELFNIIIIDEVKKCYAVSQGLARHQDKGLRLRLRIQPPELASLPWEYLYDPSISEYICLSRYTPIVRYIDLPQPIQPLVITPPLRILGIIASPSDLQRLDIDLEKTRVEQAVGHLVNQGIVELVWLEGQSSRDLQRAMRQKNWHILHFIGHGGFDPERDEGMIALTHPDGKARFLYANELGQLLANQRSLRLALLNSCEGASGSKNDSFSSLAITLLRRGIPAVIAMQYAISDTAATEFAYTFYQALADNLPVDAAVTEARNAIHIELNNSIEWGVPVLHMRAADGVLFQFDTRNIGSTTSENKLRSDQPSAPARDQTKIVKSEIEDQQTKKDDRNNSQQSQGHRDREQEARELITGGTQSVASKNTKLVPNTQSLVQPSKRLAETPHSNLSDYPINFDWISIPAGPFYMGSDKAKDPVATDNEFPQHQLNLPEFRIARVPVTNLQYKLFIDVTGHPPPIHWQKGQIPYTKEDHPIVHISWHDATIFCNWARVRLPTEAEWEKAARGAGARIYPWGDRVPDRDRCNFDMQIGDTTPVEKYLKGSSPYGVLDMTGNVWEWTNSLFQIYPFTEYKFAVSHLDEDRVLRGGSFYHNRNLVRCATRLPKNPNDRSGQIGFRVAFIDHHSTSSG